MSQKKKFLPILFGLVALIVGYFAYDSYFYIHCDNAHVEARTLMVASKVSGHITKVNADIGDNVKAGDVLAKIDDRDYVNALNRAQAELDSIDVRLQDAQKSFNRLSSLLSKGAVTQAQLDAATASLNELKARFQSMKSQVSQAQLNAEYTEIKAPFDGYVAKRSAEVGQMVTGAAPLFGFVDSNERWIIANLKETEIADIKEGTKVDITVDALDGSRFKGAVQQLSPSTGATFTLIPPDNATGNFTKVVQRVPVKIMIKDVSPDIVHKLRAGLSAEVRLYRHSS